MREAKGANTADLYASSDHQSNFGHGRREERRCCCVEASEVFPEEVCPATLSQWPGLHSVIMVERTRSESQTLPDGSQQWKPATVERSYYLSSLAPDAHPIAEAVREHWGIENRLHWSLDVSLGEDQCRIRMGNAAINMATLRHIALNLLRMENSKKRGIKTKISRAAWDEEYLLKVIAGPQS